MKKPSSSVSVNLGERSYEIAIGANLLTDAASRILACVKATQGVVITDANVADRHATKVVESLTDSGVKCGLVAVPPGESTKSVDWADRLWRHLLEFQSDRKTVIVAIGGGVVGDLAGFVAATFARGLPFIQVPTTLLAQVDSSVGGKVGVNLPDAKNMVGAFWQPRGVIIDTEVLSTLPAREYRSGLAEVVKYGVILDESFFEFLERHIEELNSRDPATLEFVIARSCELKASVVEKDEREETGLRAVLNYGHTFCHAIEAVTEYGRYLHGEAVAIGMICASKLAESMGRIPAEATRRQLELLEALGLPTAVPDISRDELLAAMRHDKKVEHGQLRFVLPTRIGHVELVGGVDAELARQAMS